MATDRLIHWVCTSVDHRRRTDLGLTRHEGQWAMCPELLGDGHEWTETGGVEVQDAVARWRDASQDAPRPGASVSA